MRVGKFVVSLGERDMGCAVFVWRNDLRLQAGTVLKRWWTFLGA